MKNGRRKSAVYSNKPTELESTQLTTYKDSPDVIVKIYRNKLRELFGNELTEETTNKKDSVNSSKYVTSKGCFSLYYSDGYTLIGIDIDGADTGYWHNDEYDSLDVLFWYAVGVLRNGVRYRKPLIGVEQAWIYSDENESWAVVPSKEHNYGYTKFVKKSPNFNSA